MTEREVQIAHVIVLSDNRENAKRLAKGTYINWTFDGKGPQISI